MKETISFIYPAKVNYISAIRLAASGVVATFNFSVDRINDIKSCVAEACMMLMCSQTCESLHIDISCSDGLCVTIKGVGAEKSKDCKNCMEFNAEMSKIILQSLAKDVTMKSEEGAISEIVFTI